MDTEFVSENVTLIDAPFMGRSGVLGTYLIKGEYSMIVDPGPTVSITYVLRELEKHNIINNNLQIVAPTHIHLDHAAGCWKILNAHNYSKLYVHPRGAAHMIDPSRLEAGARELFGTAVSSYGEIRGVPKERIIESQDNAIIDLNGTTVQVIWTPGHSSHHQCYHVIEDKTILLGDAGGLYLHDANITLPTTPPPFNPIKAIESLERLIALKPEKLCYGHFGHTDDAIKKLENHKHQIQTWNRVVFESLEEGLGYEEILTKIRDEDPFASYIKRTLENVERAPIISLQGFVKYHEWIKSNSR
jgi:glyoxylase-like metal-dependent hydrolase (beta-lactamase superfamily II)